MMDGLIQQYAEAEELIATLAEQRGRIEMEIMRRLRAFDATYAETPSFEANIKEGSATYDPSKLRLLMEHISQADLEAKGAYIPEHEETRTVPEKWNATKVRTFANRGREIKAIIKGARIPGAPKLVVTRKENT
tara:strand:+ start:9037 stop:9438 length:402 start_codon:yes stop_codon:yes gene_type:complete